MVLAFTGSCPGPISKTVRYIKRGICAHTLALAYQLGKLPQYTQSDKVPLTNLVPQPFPVEPARKKTKKRAARENPTAQET